MTFTHKSCAASSIYKYVKQTMNLNEINMSSTLKLTLASKPDDKQSTCALAQSQNSHIATTVNHSWPSLIFCRPKHVWSLYGAAAEITNSTLRPKRASRSGWQRIIWRQQWSQGALFTKMSNIIGHTHPQKSPMGLGYLSQHHHARGNEHTAFLHP